MLNLTADFMRPANKLKFMTARPLQNPRYFHKRNSDFPKTIFEQLYEC